jgi:hypothetical protein
MTYQEIKAESQKRLDKIIEEHDVFFAFSTTQYNEQAKKGVTYLPVGMGTHVPTEKVLSFLKALKASAAVEKKQIKEAREEKQKIIVAELLNYECYYTGEIEDALPTLKGYGFTREDVKKVYKKTYALYA